MIKRHNQNGYAPIILVYTTLFLVVVGTIAFAGYYVYNYQKDKESDTPPPSQTQVIEPTPTPAPVVQKTYKPYTDTANKYKVGYPSDWTIAYTDSDTAKDWTKTTRKVFFVPPKLKQADGRNVSIELDNSGYCADQFNQKKAKDATHSINIVKVNGLDYALYDIHRFNNGSESYVGHDYFIVKNQNCYHIAFKESYSNQNYTFNNLAFFADFEYIASSIKFITPTTPTQPN